MVPGQFVRTYLEALFLTMIAVFFAVENCQNSALTDCEAGAVSADVRRPLNKGRVVWRWALGVDLSSGSAVGAIASNSVYWGGVPHECGLARLT